MLAATLTSKGQITVPKPVREVLGVGPGDRLAFRIDDEGRVSVEADTVDLRSLRRIVKPAVRGVTVEAMAEVIRRGGGRR
jgi:AbrB family looped-hinge helix DNA binding protein